MSIDATTAPRLIASDIDGTLLDRNHRARTFYEREGFSPVGTRRFSVGAGWCDDVIYARSL